VDDAVSLARVVVHEALGDDFPAVAA
jgi:hypothetical protein